MVDSICRKKLLWSLRCEELKVLVKIWYGDVTDPHAASEFVWIVERIRQWTLIGLQPVLIGWVECLRSAV